jgi:hypothetical protein
VDVWIGLISVAVGAVLGTATTLLTTRSRVDLEQRAAFDRELRSLRLPHYQALHAVSAALPRERAPGTEPTRADLLLLRETFHDWYFGPQAGGMFLTEAGRRAYFALANELQVAGRDGPEGAERATAGELGRLLDLAHRLRQQLRQDLGTAEPPKVAWTARGATPAPPDGGSGWTGPADGAGLAADPS